MGKQMYTLYDKKSFLEHMAKAIPNDVIISMTNVLDGAEVQKKKGSINIRQLHAQEFFAEPDSIRFLFSGTIPLSILLCKKEYISKDYLAKLKKSKGMTGFSIDNPY